MNAFVALMLVGSIPLIAGHGMMIDPPSRNTMWRYGFDNPKNYNDNEQNCGGFSTHWNKNKGVCGVCGDAAHLKVQPHVYPGMYANGVIARTYKQGQVIPIAVRITSNHQGYFVFKIGDIGKAPITAAKLTYTLELVEGGTRYYLPRGSGDGVFETKVKLPAGLVCDQCVLQWDYRAGNSWGCDNEGCGVGNGKQEHFINCADVKITA